MKKFLCVFVSVVILCSLLCMSVFAEEYSTEYPNVYNSGSPVWLHCQIQGLGEYVIVIDPKIDLQSFGFDGPDGYNLINNTGSTISGRAYDLNSDAGYNARWSSFYKLQLQTGSNQYGQVSYEDYNITKIYGTTLDLVDYHGDRQNDFYNHDIPDRQFHIVIVSCLVAVVLLFVISIVFKPRLFRM